MYTAPRVISSYTMMYVVVTDCTTRSHSNYTLTDRQIDHILICIHHMPRACGELKSFRDNEDSEMYFF